MDSGTTPQKSRLCVGSSFALCISVSIWIAFNFAQASADDFDSIRNDAFYEEVVRIAQPPCVFADATKQLLDRFGNTPNTESLISAFLFDETRDRNAQCLMAWMLTEIATATAREALVRYVESPIPSSSKSSLAQLEERLRVVRTCFMYLGRTRDQSLMAKLESWSTKEYWDGRTDITLDSSEQLRASQREILIVGLRKGALLGISWFASPEAVASIERLAGTTCRDLNSGLIARLLSHAKEQAGIANPEAASKSPAP